MHASSLLRCTKSIVHQFPRWHIFHMVVMGNDRELEGIDTSVEILQQLCGLFVQSLCAAGHAGVTLAEPDKHDYPVNQYNYAAKATNQVEVSSPSIKMAGPEAPRQPTRLRQYHQ